MADSITQFPVRPDADGHVNIPPDLLTQYRSPDFDFVQVEPDEDLLAKFEVRSKLTLSLCGYFMLPNLPDMPGSGWAAVPPEGTGAPPEYLFAELVEFMFWALHGQYRWEVYAEACPDDHPFKGFINQDWPIVSVEPCDTHGEHEILVHREGTIAITWIPVVNEFDVVTNTRVVSTETSVDAAVAKAEETLRFDCN